MVSTVETDISSVSKNSQRLHGQRNRTKSKGCGLPAVIIHGGFDRKVYDVNF